MSACLAPSPGTHEVGPASSGSARHSEPDPRSAVRPDIGTIIGETLAQAVACLRLVPVQLRALRDMALCRTAALGRGLSFYCADCGHRGYVYPACRNRHCPGCLLYAQRKWIEGRMGRLLPCSYYHVVFTLPAQLRPLCLSNQQVLYDLFFKTVARTLHTLAADPGRLGAKLGFTLVLHTWARDLQFHPHLHGLVSAGGLSPEGGWRSTHGKFLFPLGVAASLFKKLFLMALEEVYDEGKLSLGGSTAGLSDPEVFRRFKQALWERNWVVDIRRPFGGPAHVMKYLGRYTHRVGLSNSRLLSVDDVSVRFRTRGEKSVRLSRVEFVRRFSLHILPKGFTKIRHYGLLAPSNINGKFKQAWEAAMACEAERVRQEKAEESAPEKEEEEVEGSFVWRCPKCGRRAYRPSPGRWPPELNEWLEWLEWLPKVIALGRCGPEHLSTWRE